MNQGQGKYSVPAQSYGYIEDSLSLIYYPFRMTLLPKVEC